MSGAALQPLLNDPAGFAMLGGVRLRRYQLAVARAVVTSVLEGRGESFVIMFPRQSGKNELQAQIEAYLLLAFMQQTAELLKVSPTLRPQAQTAMRRLERVLRANPLLRNKWQKENGYIYRVGRASISFLSGAPEANIVGATASTLLEVDEAQDVLIDKYDKEIAPMAASTNATRVFWGTAWTSATLLARELRAAQRAQAADGQQRAFMVTGREVAREVIAYGQFLRLQEARLGRQHPMIRTQFYCEELDAAGTMFPAERLARMMGGGSIPADGPFALLVDVGGEDMPGGEDVRRDATAATLVAVDLAGLSDPTRRAPVYRPLLRKVWVGTSHTALYHELLALAEAYRVRRVVIDATGLGAGLASFLERALPGRVTRFVFSLSSKSKLGWDFLSLVDAGRWQEQKTPADMAAQPYQQEFMTQLMHCHYEVLPGPGRLMRWGVPDGTRDTNSGEPVHDDLVMSAALVVALEGESWGSSRPALIVPSQDPLAGMTRF